MVRLTDLLGNYYLAPIDRYLKEFGVPSARYVDDIYIFLSSVGQADELLRELIPKLRSYDLVLNEAKSAVMPKAALATEEPDLEELFSRAVKEVSEQTSDEEFYGDYGFQSEWEDEAEPSEELELEATKALFDSLPEFTGSEENIERFCLPLFSKAESDYAVNHVMESFRNRPGMSQIYASYLAKFLGVGEIDEFLGKAAADGALFDWQRMWALAALSQGQDPGDDLVKIALDVIEDANRHEALRAVAIIFVGRFGDHARRRTLVEMYRSASEYLKAAIYYSARGWPTAENKTARSSWSGHGRLNNLLAIGVSKK